MTDAGSLPTPTAVADGSRTRSAPRATSSRRASSPRAHRARRRHRGGRVAATTSGSATVGRRSRRVSVDKHPAPDSSVATASKLASPSQISHDDPLRLWIGGDSLAGSFGPALGETRGATGVVDSAHRLQGVERLADHGIRDWPEHAQQEMPTTNPEARRVHHRRERRVDRELVRLRRRRRPRLGGRLPHEDRRDDADLRRRGAPPHRVLARSPPTMGDHEPRKRRRTSSVGVMRSEAAKCKPDVVYVDTYACSPTENGHYRDTCSTPNGESQQHARSPTACTSRVDGGEVPRRQVWTSVSTSVGSITEQADPSQPIDYTIAEGSNDYVPGVGVYRPTVPSHSSDTTPSSSDTTPPSDTTTVPATSPVPTTTHTRCDDDDARRCRRRRQPPATTQNITPPH